VPSMAMLVAASVLTWVRLLCMNRRAYASKDRRFGSYMASVSRVSMAATKDDAVGLRTKDISITLFGVLRPFQWHHSDPNQHPQDPCDLIFDGNIAIPAIGRQSKTARGILRLDSEESVQLSELYMCPLILVEDEDTRRRKLEGLVLTRKDNVCASRGKEQKRGTRLIPI
jgi:hypothetical protein